ncbi:MAG TPA: hypothetical protein VHB21_25420, partial [Minicystis sp.]|nr:hypothetical protein [Minicystis sp.]
AIVTGFFLWRADAARAVTELATRGVPAPAIRELPKHTGHERDLGVRACTKAPEGAALGAVLGGAVGAFSGALLAAGAVVVPALGEVLAGPLVAALAVGGALGALGLLIGLLVGARRPEYEATVLSDAVACGGVLIAVHCPSESAASVADGLYACGADSVSTQ